MRRAIKWERVENMAGQCSDGGNHWVPLIMMPMVVLLADASDGAADEADDAVAPLADA